MHRGIPLVLLTALITGCVSTPQTIRGASISDVGERAASDDPDDRNLDDVGTEYVWPDEDDDYEDDDYDDHYTDPDAYDEHASSSRAATHRTDDEFDDPDDTGLDTIKLWVERRFAHPPASSFYQTDTAWGLGVAAFDDTVSVGGTVFYAPADFTVDAGDTLEDVMVLGWQLDLSGRYGLTDQVTLSYGGGISWAWLRWDYANPLQDGGDTIESDSLSSFGLIAPLGLESRFGPVMTELTVTPTLRLSADYSGEGFENDLGDFHASLPIALRLGIVF